MPEIGVPELLIVAVVLLLLFGPGKAADLGGALGRSVREFRKASTETGDDHAIDAPAASTARHCDKCGVAVASTATFCGECGTRVATPVGA